MSFQQVIADMPQEVYERLRTAVELGKWPDGRVLNEEQKATSLQAVMAWQALHLTDPEHMNIGADGNIVMKSKSELKRLFRDEAEEIGRFGDL
ncbi:YeaC family protein [Aeromonas sp. R6-2]|uniref:YeaC family protein n=1 Tax=unclassified Aeromonas TaxID=257493 RepID=UPI0034A4ADA2